MKSIFAKLIIISLFSMVFQGIFLNQPSSGAEICFSSIPDSAWVNGEPEEVKKSLNFELVGKSKKIVSVEEPASLYDVLAQGSSNLIDQVQYDYVGKNCQSRIVKVTKTIQGPKLEIADRAKFENEVNKRSLNFLDAQNAIKKVDEYINNLTLSNTYNLNFDENMSSNMLFQRILGKSGVPTTSGSSIVVASSAKDCYFNDQIGTSRSYSSRVSGKFISSSTLRFANNRCILDVYVYYNLLGSFPNKTPNSDLLYKLGSLTVIRIPEETTIICVNRNKKTIKLSGTNPKCPAGYKKQ